MPSAVTPVNARSVPCCSVTERASGDSGRAAAARSSGLIGVTSWPDALSSRPAASRVAPLGVSAPPPPPPNKRRSREAIGGGAGWRDRRAAGNVRRGAAPKTAGACGRREDSCMRRRAGSEARACGCRAPRMYHVRSARTCCTGRAIERPTPAPPPEAAWRRASPHARRVSAHGPRRSRPRGAALAAGPGRA